MPQGKRGGEKEYVVENKNNRSSFLLSNNSQNLIDETKITFFLVNGDFFLFFKLFFIFCILIFFFLSILYSNLIGINNGGEFESSP